MQKYPEIGVLIPEILLPRADIDPGRWAVIACDQFTSQPNYWQEVKAVVGDGPTTLQLVLPEIYLEEPDVAQRIQRIQAAMDSYLEAGIFTSHTNMVYVERTVAGRTRQGIVLALDLERYDYTIGANSLIRATEGTIVDRLPPRIKIREGARLELPHILVLIDDPQNSVIDPVAQQKDSLTRLYDFDLMLGSGHLRGYAIDRPELESGIIQALRRLADPQVFAHKYGLESDQPVLLYAMGDGNHSLATAKAYWEKIKPVAGPDHPARYALVEIENVHDQGLEFEPIHRVLFHIHADLMAELETYFTGRLRFHPRDSYEQVTSQVDGQSGDNQLIGYLSGEKCGVLEISRPQSNLPVGTLQPFLNQFMEQSGAEKIDYVHGLDVLVKLGRENGNAGFYLPGMSKNELFRTVILDGALPRKTFSMGEAHEKRFYMESRRIG